MTNKLTSWPQAVLEAHLCGLAPTFKMLSLWCWLWSSNIKTAEGIHWSLFSRFVVQVSCLSHLNYYCYSNCICPFIIASPVPLDFIFLAPSLKRLETPVVTLFQTLTNLLVWIITCLNFIQRTKKLLYESRIKILSFKVGLSILFQKRNSLKLWFFAELYEN